MRLIEYDDIMGAKYKVFPPITGIYFLVNGNEIVYVGQSTDVEFRVRKHLKEGKKTFDSFYSVSCNQDQLDVLEAEYIVHFNPKYNVLPPSSKSRWRSMHGLKKTLNTGVLALKRYMQENNISDTNGWYNINDFMEITAGRKAP